MNWRWQMPQVVSVGFRLSGHFHIDDGTYIGNVTSFSRLSPEWSLSRSKVLDQVNAIYGFSRLSPEWSLCFQEADYHAVGCASGSLSKLTLPILLKYRSFLI